MDEALAKCKERGGTDPHIKAQWHDYYYSFDNTSKTSVGLISISQITESLFALTATR